MRNSFGIFFFVVCAVIVCVILFIGSYKFLRLLYLCRNRYCAFLPVFPSIQISWTFRCIPTRRAKDIYSVIKTIFISDGFVFLIAGYQAFETGQELFFFFTDFSYSSKFMKWLCLLSLLFHVSPEKFKLSKFLLFAATPQFPERRELIKG